MKTVFKKIIVLMACILMGSAMYAQDDASQLLEKARQGNVVAQTRVGDYYMQGTNGFSRDYYAARTWLKKAVEQKYVEAYFLYGLCLKNIAEKEGNKDVAMKKEAFHYTRLSANLGNALGQFYCGLWFEQGMGTMVNIDSAIYWYRKSAENGVPYAKNKLSDLGQDVDKDKGKEISSDTEKLLDAARRGSVPAIIEVGDCYMQGKNGFKRDFYEARKWLEKTVRIKNLAYPNAYFLYGICLKRIAEMEGNQDNVMKRDAFLNTRKSAMMGYCMGQFYLGVWHEQGMGTPVNIDSAVYWYRKSAEYGISYAKKKLAALGQDTNFSINKKITVSETPKITWINCDPITTSRSFSFKAGVNSNSKVKSTQVWVNGQEERGISAVKDDGYNMIVNRTVNLQDGKNTIRVAATNASGTTWVEKEVTYNKPQKKNVTQQNRRIALVMGNANYRDANNHLNNPVNDATDVASKLEKLGFRVIRSLDQTKQGMETAIAEFGRQAKSYDVALFYYAGHAITHDGDNYLIPIDANLPEESYVRYNCVNASLVLDELERAGCEMKIMILDACRNAPFKRAWSRGVNGGNGLSFIKAPKGTFIAYATAPGETAADGTKGNRNSPYTSALLQTLDIPNLPINEFFDEVHERVTANTNDLQQPWVSKSMSGKFVFNIK